MRQLKDFEPEYEWTDDTGRTYQLEKVGGGTVGKAYDGLWRYAVLSGGSCVARGEDFRTGMPTVHDIDEFNHVTRKLKPVLTEWEARRIVRQQLDKHWPKLLELVPILIRDGRITL